MVIKTRQYSRNAQMLASWLVDQGVILQNAIGRPTDFPRDVDARKRQPPIIDLCFTRGI
jgi:hypothetical protein